MKTNLLCVRFHIFCAHIVHTFSDFNISLFSHTEMRNYISLPFQYISICLLPVQESGCSSFDSWVLVVNRLFTICVLRNLEGTKTITNFAAQIQTEEQNQIIKLAYEEVFLYVLCIAFVHVCYWSAVSIGG
ncbi:MAG: hypothetical protein J5506_01875 [Prevotella sp.]|nr:hypothetical protein [Prevotella sp.]